MTFSGITFITINIFFNANKLTLAMISSHCAHDIISCLLTYFLMDLQFISDDKQIIIYEEKRTESFQLSIKRLTGP